jgi:hypothetical protein
MNDPKHVYFYLYIIMNPGLFMNKVPLCRALLGKLSYPRLVLA